MRQLTIMVVDDDPDDINLFKDYLSEVDDSCLLIVASDGTEALQQLRNNTSRDPDIIFLDYNMPIMNGIHCLAALKEDPQLKNIQVVMHSTSLPEEETIFCKSLGAKILIKQVIYANMLHELNNILSEIRSGERLL